MTTKTAEERLRYAKQYAHVLICSPIGEQTGDLLQLAPNKRIHVMKAISSLARFVGMQDSWLAIRKRYGLQWSTGTEKIDAFARFFDNAHSLDNMLHWLREAIEVLPVPYSRFLLFCTLTGMRGSECIESVRLLNHHRKAGDKVYYNASAHALEHFRFPELFIRRTKAVYISVVNDEIIALARDIGKPHSKRPKDGN
ncbi:MAG TPA: hypothetical protein VFR94_01370 [Nitrososphaeraceae archaeon]|nr:hypothetical protein [Nitrososphaeraceae archaeon]